jgi:hypothetical protein
MPSYVSSHLTLESVPEWECFIDGIKENYIIVVNLENKMLTLPQYVKIILYTRMYSYSVHVIQKQDIHLK